MPLSNSHKALIITFLLVGTVLLMVLNLSINKTQAALVEETFYDLEKIDDIAEKEPLEVDNKSISTNKAYNATKRYKPFSEAYQIIEPPEDFKPNIATEQSNSDHENNSESDGESTIADNEITTFKSVNSILSKRSQNIKSSTPNEDAANTNSSIYYSLKNRTHIYLPIPVYLCDETGKIVINITVNESGKVINAYYNNSSTSKNECLKDHALEYAKQARFNTSSKKKQLGSITFLFK
ncbi:TonB family protein [Lacinutrix salivirga]